MKTLYAIVCMRVVIGRNSHQCAIEHKLIFDTYFVLIYLHNWSQKNIEINCSLCLISVCLIKDTLNKLKLFALQKILPVCS